MKTLCVYNTCEIQNHGNTAYYVRALQNLHKQLGREDKICVSGCMMTLYTMIAIQDDCPFCTIIGVEEVLPLNVTFNFAVKKMRERHGDFTHYVYFDSGIDINFPMYGNKIESYGRFPGKLETLLKCATGNTVCAASIVDTDAGYSWLYVSPPEKHEPPLKLPLHKTVNLHCQVWTHEFLQKYPHILPDIFASDCSEQVTPYLCSAIERDFVLAPVMFHHEHPLDGASSGFTRGSGWDVRLFRSPKTRDQLFREGHAVGWGFEENAGMLMHNPARFRDHGHGYADGPKLYEWLRDNMFLRDFDYDGIKHAIWDAGF